MTLYLPNHDAHARVLAYDPETGAREELPRARLTAGRKADLGFYVNAGDGVVGIYASPDGPIVFRDGDRYRLADCRVELKLTDDRGVFTLFDGATPRVHVEYRRTPHKHFDAWSDDEAFVDFYQWLDRAAREPKFCPRYTRPW